MSELIEQHHATQRGGILYDASQVRKPAPELFAISHWRAQGRMREATGGRGSVVFIDMDGQRWVLRHYRRGGLIAHLSADRYLWLGADRTRAFREWRLLAELYRRGLPVPRPVAAQYERFAITYRADLITEQLQDAVTLADAITNGSLGESGWRAIGQTIAAFHRHGVQHADLNAHNILLATEHSSARAVYILDFDRGRIRERGPWESAVIARLQRSLHKIAAQRGNVAFGEQQWRWMTEEVNSES